MITDKDTETLFFDCPGTGCGAWETAHFYLYSPSPHSSEKPDIISMGRRREKILNRSQLHQGKFWRRLAGTPVGSYICAPDTRSVTFGFLGMADGPFATCLLFWAPVFWEPLLTWIRLLTDLTPGNMAPDRPMCAPTCGFLFIRVRTWKRRGMKPLLSSCVCCPSAHLKQAWLCHRATHPNTDGAY